MQAERESAAADVSNSERYHFADFTRENYRRLVRLAAVQYSVRSYADFDEHGSFVLWRHDVDFSMHSARQLARVEAEEGVRATYFLHLHNEFYNLLERGVVDVVRDILALGHDIGLHFDSHHHGVERESDLAEHLARERGILEDTFGSPVRVFSFHNTTPFTMACTRHEYAGMLNVYSEYFQRRVGYCSDSYGYWRFERLEDVLRQRRDERLQVLTHPEWWQDEVMSPRERIERCITGRAERARELYERRLAAVGRTTIDWT